MECTSRPPIPAHRPAPARSSRPTLPVWPPRCSGPRVGLECRGTLQALDFSGWRAEFRGRPREIAGGGGFGLDLVLRLIVWPRLIVRLRLAVVVRLCLCGHHAARVPMSDWNAGERSKAFPLPRPKWGRLPSPGVHPSKPKPDFHPNQPKSGLSGTLGLPGIPGLPATSGSGGTAG